MPDGTGWRAYLLCVRHGWVSITALPRQTTPAAAAEQARVFYQDRLTTLPAELQARFHSQVNENQDPAALLDRVVATGDLPRLHGVDWTRTSSTSGQVRVPLDDVEHPRRAADRHRVAAAAGTQESGTGCCWPATGSPTGSPPSRRSTSSGFAADSKPATGKHQRRAWLRHDTVVPGGRRHPDSCCLQGDAPTVAAPTSSGQHQPPVIPAATSGFSHAHPRQLPRRTRRNKKSTRTMSGSAPLASLPTGG